MPRARTLSRDELLSTATIPVDPGAGELAVDGPLAERAHEGALALRTGLELAGRRRRAVSTAGTRPAAPPPASCS